MLQKDVLETKQVNMLAIRVCLMSRAAFTQYWIVNLVVSHHTISSKYMWRDIHNLTKSQKDQVICLQETKWR